MKKLVSALLAMLMILSCFSGAFAEEEVVELRYHDLCSTTARMEFFEDLFERFYQETGIRFVYGGEPWDGGHRNLLTMMASGNGPDVFTCSPHNELYIKNGWLLPIDEWVQEHGDEYVALVTNYLWENERNVYGHNYIFPDGTMGRGIYYRKDWVEEIGYEIPTGKDWNWNEFWKLAEALNDPERDRYGFAFRGGPGIDGWAKNYFEAYTGTYIYDPETLQWKAEEYREAMKTYTDCFVNGLSPQDSLNWGWAEQIDAFCSGLVGLFYNDSDCFPIIMERMEESQWGILPLPYSNDGKGVPVPSGINPTYSYAINAKTEHPEECFALMEFLNRPENTVAYCTMMGVIPLRKDVEAHPYFSEEGPLGAFVTALSNPDSLLGGQLIGVNFETWAGYKYDLAGEMQMYLLGEITFDELYDAWREWNETAIANYFAENPDSANDVYRVVDVLAEIEG